MRNGDCHHYNLLISIHYRYVFSQFLSRCRTHYLAFAEQVGGRCKLLWYLENVFKYVLDCWPLVDLARLIKDHALRRLQCARTNFHGGS